MGLPDDLERLHRLHLDGALTDAEYARGKAALLDATGPAPTRVAGDGGSPTGRDEGRWALYVHLSLLAGLVVPLLGFVLPIVLWQMRKTEIPGLDDHGREVTNWMISSVIYGVVGAALTFVWIGFPLLIALGIMSIVFPVIGGLKANEGVLWRYPLSIRFLRPTRPARRTATSGMRSRRARRRAAARARAAPADGPPPRRTPQPS